MCSCFLVGVPGSLASPLGFCIAVVLEVELETLEG